MAKTTPAINNFNAGELNPLVDCRSDISKYASGCKKLENAIPLIKGGAKKMPGTYSIKVSSIGGWIGALDGVSASAGGGHTRLRR